jgi:hypothetical protein
LALLVAGSLRFGTLSSLALVGSFLKPDPRIRSLRCICLVAVSELPKKKRQKPRMGSLAL